MLTANVKRFDEMNTNRSLDREQEDLPKCQTVAFNLKFYDVKVVVCLQSFADVCDTQYSVQIFRCLIKVFSSSCLNKENGRSVRSSGLSRILYFIHINQVQNTLCSAFFVIIPLNFWYFICRCQSRWTVIYFLIALEINNVFSVVVLLLYVVCFVSESLSEQSEITMETCSVGLPSHRTHSESLPKTSWGCTLFCIISSDVSWKEWCHLVLSVEKTEKVCIMNDNNE